MKTKTAIWLSVGFITVAGVVIYLMKQNQKKEQEIKELEKKNQEVKAKSGLLESLLNSVSSL